MFFRNENRRQRLQEAVLDSFVDAVVTIDVRNRVVFFNEAAEKLWGYAREEVIGREVSMLLPAELRASHHRFITANRRGEREKGIGATREVQFERKDGSLGWASITLSRAALEDGLGYTALMRDISAEHKLRTLFGNRLRLTEQEV